MRYVLLAYNKDKDTYDGIRESNNKEELETLANSLLSKLRKGELKDKTGEPYDWFELWDEQDDNGENDIVYY